MALGVIQWGKEGTSGTDAVAKAVLESFGSAEWGDDTAVDQPEFLDGTYALHSNGSTLGTIGRLQLRNGVLDYEQFPWWLSSGLKAVAAATATGAGGNDYTWTFDPTLTADDTFNTATYEAQNDTDIEQMTYGTVESFEIGLGGPRARTDFSVNLFGRPWATTTLTTGVSHVATELVNGTNWQMWLDASGGTIGTTLYASCLKGFRFQSGPLRSPYECIDGTNQFTGVARPRFNPQLTVRMAVDSSLAGVVTQWRNGTRLLLQLKATGGIIHDAVHKAVTIQMAGRITAMSRVGATREQEQWIREITIMGERDATWAKEFKFQVVNGENVLRGA